MKRFFLFTAVVFSLLIQSGQLFAQNGFHIGGSLGMMNIRLTQQQTWGLPHLKKQPRSQFDFHGVIGGHFARHLGLQIELTKTIRGAWYEETVGGSKVVREVDLSYWHLPILAKTFAGPKRFKLTMMVGPTLAILENATETYQTGNLKNALDVTDRFNKTDWLFTLEPGVDLYVTRWLFLHGGFRFYRSFRDINQGDPDWKMPPPSGSYKASRNLAYGLNFSLHLLFGNNWK